MKCHRIITSYFFPENLLPWQRYNAFSCTPKIESYRVIKRTDRWNLLKLLYYMLLGMIVKICNLKKICRTEGSKNLIFDYCFLNFFSHLHNFLKIGIDTHPIDLSFHQKFEKNSPTGSENISARSWKIWKSHGRLDPTLRMREVVHARSIKFPRMRNDQLPSGRILCDKEIFFSLRWFYGLQEK